jgi:sRNA-binding protein
MSTGVAPPLTLRGDLLQRAAGRLGLPTPSEASPATRSDRITELLTALRGLAPAAFCDPPRPLAIGIRATIVQRGPADYPPRIVAKALRRRCRRPGYLRALVAGGRGVLDGEPCGGATGSEAEHARARQRQLAAHRAGQGQS